MNIHRFHYDVKNARLQKVGSMVRTEKHGLVKYFAYDNTGVFLKQGKLAECLDVYGEPVQTYRIRK